MTNDCAFTQQGSRLLLDCASEVGGNLGFFQLVLIAIVGVLAFFIIWLAIGPIYRVWGSKKTGQAALAEAEYEQQIQRAKADGRLNAAKKNKEAAIIEAEAVAAQIKEIGEHLTQHELYLRWQWIRMMEERDSENDTIYVATEAGLPILEASRGVRKGQG